MKKIENIIFDLGGVVLNIDYELTVQAFVENGLSRFPDIYSQLSQTHLFDDYETGKITTDAFIAHIRTLAPELSRAQIVSSWNAMLLDLPLQKIVFIDNLKSRFKTFLFSNTNQLHEAAFNGEVERVTGQPTLDSFFQKVYLSHKIGYRKPHREGFELILSDNKLVPEHTLFIDDSPQHIEGAQQLGLQTLFLHKDKDLITELSALLNG